MAGTAAGAAKASQARREKAAARRAAVQQSRATVNDINEQSSSTVATVGASLPSLPAVAPVDQVVSALAAPAGVVAHDILTGKIKAGPAVRGNLALRVLELAAKPAQAAAATHGLAAVVGALGRALASRAQVAEPAVIGGEVVSEQ